MSTAPTVEQLIERNKQYAASASSHPLISELASENLPTPNVVVLTCADPRCIPERFLGLGTDNRKLDAVIMRNVCGHAAPALNDIIALDHFLGFTDIMVIHHTDCGSLHFTDEQVRETIRKRGPNDKSVDAATFGAIKNLEQSVRDDLAVIRGYPLLRKELADRSHGYIYDIKTGLLNPVDD
ncbi:carbonic anhydrase [Usnea florida]